MGERKIAEKAGAGLLQEDPNPPQTWGTFKGQSSKGGDAVEMLEFILEETKKEEKVAHRDEESSQRDYEDSMQNLKDEEADNQKIIVNLQRTIAEKEKEKMEKEKELKDTVKDKEAIED